ncbi:MAG: deoxyribose-phosphate aldolase [Armatimonadetes bacterium]|jgi:deoxyribose-phosphate aldolase|nr:deoxyribose-phosphate aldolase [Armatimonadota bacterium]
MTQRELAATLDMTLLKPSAAKTDIVSLCERAVLLKPAAVCVFPIWVKTAARVVAGSGVAVCTVAGFPTGCSVRGSKMHEVRAAIAGGATEVDMVLNLGALKTGDWGEVQRELSDLLETARVTAMEVERPVVTKVILECCYLTDDEKVRAADLCQALGANFVKTSTGFGTGGATLEDVRLLRKTVGPEMGVKAAGGIRTLEDALAMLEAGATRIGTSAAETILEEASKLPEFA